MSTSERRYWVSGPGIQVVIGVATA
ncbi:hypothetical protein EYZ11_000342 [Aspergillus tanneri]|uniref:Uncharacterized protein n=1 Tax=Aspergillus tanneri TaxID=1220188 RepID=A0A4V3UQS4_9EURO|nr:hypothetical protein EYZ11_000342 [Aspergillus tanneri]